MCALLSDVVQRQIRNRQFTADVIDSIVGRLAEVRIPIPLDPDWRAQLTADAKRIFQERAESRLRLAVLSRQLDDALVSGGIPSLMKSIEAAPEDVDASGTVNFLGGSYPAESFTITEGAIEGNILLPRYYDPAVLDSLSRFAENNDMISVGDLLNDGVISLQTGDEVGKLAYGTGDVPFVRTSDPGNWELKHDPKQRISRDIYEGYASKQGAVPRDILLVRDGTYLVGSSGMVMPADVPLLFSGGMYRIRIEKPEVLDPFLLLALLNSQVAGRQMRNKRFTRDVIDTLGKRIHEVILPIPKSRSAREAIAEVMRDLLEGRAALRSAAAKLGDRLITRA
jgi:hypothetical protein